jgi:hypothetical protein
MAAEGAEELSHGKQEAAESPFIDVVGNVKPERRILAGCLEIVNTNARSDAMVDAHGAEIVTLIPDRAGIVEQDSGEAKDPQAPVRHPAKLRIGHNTIITG